MLGTNTFAFNQTTTNDLSQDFKITRIDYYLSKFTIIHDGGTETTVPAGTYILAKGNANVSVNLGNFNVTNVEGIKFHVGVDSPNNNDDPAQWPVNHPLAPQNPSMHWGWAAGYIYMAVEGKAGPSFNTTFQMHGMGNPNYFMQTVMAPGVDNGNDVYINLDADYAMAVRGIDIAAGPIDHGADATDLEALINFRDYVFSHGQGFVSSINNDNLASQISIFPNPNNGRMSLVLPLNQGKNIVGAIYDMKGQLVKNILTTGTSNVVDIDIDAKGIYVLELTFDGQNLIRKKIIVD